jgi:hypothetical protein
VNYFHRHLSDWNVIGCRKFSVKVENILTLRNVKMGFFQLGIGLMDLGV